MTEPRPTTNPRPTTTRLTVAQALVRFLAAQYTERDGVRRRLIDSTWGVFGPQPQVLGVLDQLVTGEDVIVDAAGSLPGDLHRPWRARSRDQYHVEYGYSCVGYEIPAAIGVRLAAPDRPVWALVATAPT